MEGGKTVSGRTCQRWSEQSPHEHNYGHVGDHNYCRKAGENFTWCYTMDTEKRWEVCNQRICSDTPDCLESLEGGKTVSGRTCQRWSDQTPHGHNYSFIGDHNYCRKEGFNFNWCYTTDAEKEWDFCNQTICSDTGGRTVSGRTCQRWSEQNPHEHSYSYVGNHNFCRNPSDHSGLWCFTTDPNKAWDDCNDTTIESKLKQPGAECENKNKFGLDYRGTASVTERGFHCKPWILSTQYQHLAETLVHPETSACRSHGKNDNGKLNNQWCYTTDEDTRWDVCDVPDCTHEVGQDDLFKMWMNLFYCITAENIDENGIMQVISVSKHSNQYKSKYDSSLTKEEPAKIQIVLC